jgi:hypothetical protein
VTLILILPLYFHRFTGLSARRGGNTPSSYWPFNFGGVMYLKAGDTLSSWVHSNYDTSYLVTTYTGFSVALISEAVSCETCQDGYYASKPCTLRESATCSKCTTTPCATGQYLASPCTPSTDRKCAACSTCSNGERQLQACTNTSDTKCSSLISFSAGMCLAWPPLVLASESCRQLFCGNLASVFCRSESSNRDC